MINIREILLLFTLFITSLFEASGSETEKKYKQGLPIDTARFEIIYTHVALDQVLDRTDFFDEMLMIGDSVMKYGGYGNYQLDSINAEYKKRNIELSIEERDKLNREYRTLSETMYTYPEKRQLDFYGFIFINRYKYTEPLPEFDWEITDQTDEILGHECVKATARWRGREWNAWFSDIPIDGGPWKFRGLPGLILKVEDSEGIHTICADEIREDAIPIPPPYSFVVKSDRKKYNEALKDLRINAGQVLINSGMARVTEEEKNQIRKRRLFYSPIELE